MFKKTKIYTYYSHEIHGTKPWQRKLIKICSSSPWFSSWKVLCFIKRRVHLIPFCKIKWWLLSWCDEDNASWTMISLYNEWVSRIRHDSMRASEDRSGPLVTCKGIPCQSTGTSSPVSTGDLHVLPVQVTNSLDRSSEALIVPFVKGFICRFCIMGY